MFLCDVYCFSLSLSALHTKTVVLCRACFLGNLIFLVQDHLRLPYHLANGLRGPRKELGSFMGTASYECEHT